MIITDDFVYIHQPKTGGTFVTHVLEQLYQGRPFINTHKHGTCSDIPAEHQGKPILTTVRNPYDRYVSQYHFGWWRRYPDAYCGVEEMRAHYPSYPDVSFPEFVRMANSLFLNRHQRQETGFRNERFPEERRLGWHTEQFVRFYCREPRAVFQALDEESLTTGRYRETLFPLRITRAENLNQQLHDALLELGLPRERLAFILDAQKVFPEGGGRADEDRWQNYYTPELKQFVRTRERMLFQLFPDYDI